MSVAVRVHFDYVMPHVMFFLGVCPHYGFLGLLRWTNAEHIVRCWHFWLVYNPPDRQALQAPFLQYSIRKLSGASRTSRHDHDLRSYERLFPSPQVGRVPYLLLYSDHDDQCHSRSAWTRLDGRCVRCLWSRLSKHRPSADLYSRKLCLSISFVLPCSRIPLHWNDCLFTLLLCSALNPNNFWTFGFQHTKLRFTSRI